MRSAFIFVGFDCCVVLVCFGLDFFLFCLGLFFGGGCFVMCFLFGLGFNVYLKLFI